MTEHLSTTSLTICGVTQVTRHVSTPSRTIYCVKPVTKCLSIPLWWSTVSNQ